MEARALLGLCDRYYLLTQIIGRADMLWHGESGEAVPAGNVWLYERCLAPRPPARWPLDGPENATGRWFDSRRAGLE